MKCHWLFLHALRIGLSIKLENSINFYVSIMKSHCLFTNTAIVSIEFDNNYYGRYIRFVWHVSLLFIECDNSISVCM